MAAGKEFFNSDVLNLDFGSLAVQRIASGNVTVWEPAMWTAFIETSRAGGTSDGGITTATGGVQGGSAGTSFTLSTGTPTTPVTSDSGPAVLGTPTGQARSGSVNTCGAWGPATGPSANILLDQTRSCTTTFNLGASTRVDTIPTATTASTRTDVIRTPISRQFRIDTVTTTVSAIIAQQDRHCERVGTTVVDAQCPVDGLPSARAVTVQAQSSSNSFPNITLANAFNSDSNSTVTVTGPTTGSRQTTTTVIASSTGNTEAFTGTFTDGQGQSRTINNPAYVAPALTFSFGVTGPATNHGTYRLENIGGTATGAITYQWSSGGSANGGASTGATYTTTGGGGPFSISCTATRGGIPHTAGTSGFVAGGN